MRGLYLFTIILSLLVAVIPAKAANPEILDSLINTALRNNPDYRSAQYNEESADYHRRAAGKLPDPQLSLSLMNLPKSSLSLNETPMSGVQLGLTQTIPWPGKLSAQGKKAGLQTEFQKQATFSTRNQLIRQVTQSYYAYAHQQKAKDVTLENIKLLELLIESLEVRYANGEISAQDVLRAQTSLSRLKNRLLDIDRQRQTAQLQLSRLIDDVDLKQTELPAVIPEIDSTSIDSDRQGQKLDNPMLNQADIAYELSQNKLNLAKSEYWPNLMVGLDYRIRNEVPGDPIHGEDFIGARFGITLPLWFFSKQKHENQSARVAIQSAEAKRKAVKLEIERMIEDARISLKTLSERYREYKDVIQPQAEAAYEAAQVAYEVGRVDFNGLLASQMDLLDIELEKLEVQTRFFQKQAELEEIYGNQ